MTDSEFWDTHVPIKTKEDGIMKRIGNVLMTVILAAVSIAVMCSLAMAAEKVIQTQPATLQPPQQPLNSPSATASLNCAEVLKNFNECTKNAEKVLEQKEQCTKENQQLRDQNKTLQQQNSDLQKKLNATTHPGGSAVKAYCESPTVSRNTAGATNNCGATGYMCEPVSGLCRTSCTSSQDCASGYVCDTLYGRCIHN
jgi:hypothetical protein